MSFRLSVTQRMKDGFTLNRQRTMVPLLGLTPQKKPNKGLPNIGTR